MSPFIVTRLTEYKDALMVEYVARKKEYEEWFDREYDARFKRYIEEKKAKLEQVKKELRDLEKNYVPSKEEIDDAREDVIKDIVEIKAHFPTIEEVENGIKSYNYGWHNSSIRKLKREIIILERTISPTEGFFTKEYLYGLYHASALLFYTEELREMRKPYK